jgi:hypothetical protein
MAFGQTPRTHAPPLHLLPVDPEGPDGPSGADLLVRLRLVPHELFLREEGARDLDGRVVLAEVERGRPPAVPVQEDGGEKVLRGVLLGELEAAGSVEDRHHGALRHLPIDEVKDAALSLTDVPNRHPADGPVVRRLPAAVGVEDRLRQTDPGPPTLDSGLHDPGLVAPEGGFVVVELSV